MNRLPAFLKATLLGGVLLVLPAWRAVLLVVKAMMHAARRVHRLDLPALTLMQCLSKWGAGSAELVAAYDAARRAMPLPTPAT